jgi:hypothetical protein
LSPVRPSGHGDQSGFFARRWRGEVAAAPLFWRDMLGVGTLVNLGMSFVALMLASQGAPGGLAVAVHFSPLPYNVFLFMALWRLPGRTRALTLLAVSWLVLMTVV